MASKEIVYKTVGEDNAYEVCVMCNQPIDLVLPWVDGQDPAWRAEKINMIRCTGHLRFALSLGTIYSMSSGE